MVIVPSVIAILPPGHGVHARGHSVGVRQLLLTLAGDRAGHRGGGQPLLLGGVQDGVLVVLGGGLAGIRAGVVNDLLDPRYPDLIIILTSQNLKQSHCARQNNKTQYLMLRLYDSDFNALSAL